MDVLLGDEDPRRPPSKTRVQVKPPAGRHYISRISKSMMADDLTTFIQPHVDVRADIRAIEAGLAVRVGERFQVNERIYQQKPNGTLFPISGDGFVGPFTRPVLIALRADARYNEIN